MKIHFIAIGGSIMHQLAIQLLDQGHEVTGSDDTIFDPASSNLKDKGILPKAFGWYPDKISNELDMVVLGKHAHADNEELAKAKSLNLKIVTFPELIYEYAKDKIRIVVGGSHGKTTTTSMLIHTFLKNNIDCDYMVGAKIEGVKGSVKLTDTAKYIVIEGDEYPTSADDPRPKFFHYNPDIAILTGIAWDHMNVFPTFEIYKKVFADYVESLPFNTKLIYFDGDETLKDTVIDNAGCICMPYDEIDHEIVDDNVVLKDFIGNEYPTELFGIHNLQNLAAAKGVWDILEFEDKDFFQAAATFNGAAKRLEYLLDKNSISIIKDYAHSPSKVKAAVKAVRQKYPKRELVVFCELHTYSSLNKDFIPQYKDSLNDADTAIVHYDPHAMKIKRMPDLNAEEVKSAFNNSELIISNSTVEFQNIIDGLSRKNLVLLMMSSGNYGGIDLSQFDNLFSDSNSMA